PVGLRGRWLLWAGGPHLVAAVSHTFLLARGRSWSVVAVHRGSTYGPRHRTASVCSCPGRMRPQTRKAGTIPGPLGECAATGGELGPTRPDLLQLVPRSWFV